MAGEEDPTREAKDHKRKEKERMVVNEVEFIKELDIGK